MQLDAAFPTSSKSFPVPLCLCWLFIVQIVINVAVYKLALCFRSMNPVISHMFMETTLRDS